MGGLIKFPGVGGSWLAVCFGGWVGFRPGGGGGTRSALTSLLHKLQMAGTLSSFEEPLRHGYFWNQGVKLHHIGGCHFDSGLVTPLGPPYLGVSHGIIWFHPCMPGIIFERQELLCFCFKIKCFSMDIFLEL